MKKVKNFKVYEEFILSMRRYLSQYYNIESLSENTFTHQELSKLIGRHPQKKPKITLEQIKKGEIILVRDANGIVMGYKKPYILETDYEKKFYEVPASIEFDKKEKLSVNIEEVENLSDYELKSLIDKCKDYNADSIKRKLIRVLNRRKEQQGRTKEDILIKIRKREYERNDSND